MLYGVKIYFFLYQQIACQFYILVYLYESLFDRLENDPARYSGGYSKLRSWAYSSLDLYKVINSKFDYICIGLWLVQCNGGFIRYINVHELWLNLPQSLHLYFFFLVNISILLFSLIRSHCYWCRHDDVPVLYNFHLFAKYSSLFPG